MDAGSLLLDLHHIPVDNDVAMQRQVIHAINLCKERPRLFTMEVFGVVSNELVEQTPIPRLTLRTMILGVTLFPRLKKIMLNLLQKLILKKIWTLDPVLWKGFQKCISALQPQSFAVLPDLPPEPFQQLMQAESDLKPLLREYIGAIEEDETKEKFSSILKVVDGLSD